MQRSVLPIVHTRNYLYAAMVKRLVRIHTFIGQCNDVHVRPEIVRPVILSSRKEEEVLQLGKGEEGGSCDYVDAKNIYQSAMVDIKRILQG